MKYKNFVNILVPIILVCFPFMAGADIHQPDYDSDSQFYYRTGYPVANTMSVYQQLGNNITGTSGDISARVSFNAGVTAITHFRVIIVCYQDAGYTAYCGNSSLGSDYTGVPNNGTIQWATSTVPAYTLTAQNYYRLRFDLSVTNTVGTYNANIFGTSSNAYPGGVAQPNGASVFGSVDDLAFHVMGSTGGYVIADHSTHIETITPRGGSTIATSSNAVIGASGWVSDDDYKDGMYIQVRYARFSSYQSSIASPDSLYTTKSIPITSAGYFNFSTTSPITATGEYSMLAEIKSPSLSDQLLNYFGFGQFANSGIRTSSSTKFTAYAASSYDNYVASTTASVAAYVASSTISLATCTAWTSFDLGQCLNLLFVPQTQPIKEALGSFKNGFLSYTPWGYLTRFIVILTNNATGTLPTFTATFMTGPSATSSLTFDMQDMIAGGGDLLESIHDPNSGLSTRDIVEPWILLFIALSVLFIIISDFARMSHYNSSHHV